MNLKDWVSSDKDTREKLLAKWLHDPNVLRRQEWRLRKIVEEASNELAKQLAKVPRVTGVTGVCSNGGEILVTTSLTKGKKLPNIPDEFATFRVLQFAVAERKRAYLQRFELVMRAAGVPQAERRSQIEFFDRELNDIHTPFYCDTPEKWIADALARMESNGRLKGRTLVMLRGDIHRVLAEFFSDLPCSESTAVQRSTLGRLRPVLRSVLARYRPQ